MVVFWIYYVSKILFLKLIVLVCFSFSKVATRNFLIVCVACIIFLLDGISEENGLKRRKELGDFY